MKKLSILIFLIISSISPLNAQVISTSIFTGCAASELMKSDIKLLNQQASLDFKAYNHFKNNPTQKNITTVDLIPTVVHIIHNGGPENITNQQVQTAINNINSKFLSSNNHQIQLCLAQRDPLGNSTNGITRDSSVFTTDTMELNDITLKNINRWNPNCYLNIWIIKEITSLSVGPGVIGYAYFPAAHGQNMDGIVIEASYFGTSLINDAVGAHELGHYLGLYHTFENGCTNNNCLLDGDQVCDTPPDQTTFSACNGANSCNTDANDPSTNNPFTTDVSDLSDDYMDYSSLSCYTQFTSDQYSRMKFFLTTTRNSLLGCLSCTTPCPTPLSANITSPSSSTTINIGSTINFSGAILNSNTLEWYLTPGSVLSNNTAFSYTFTSTGTFWMKLRAVSSNPSLCLDDVDSVQIIVVQPPVNSCFGSIEMLNSNDAVLLPSAGSQYYYNVNGFTWECWVKLTTPFSSYNNQLLRPVMCAIDPVGWEDICLSFGWQGGTGNVPNNHLCFKVDGPNGFNGANNNSCDYFPTGGFQLGTWYHIAGTMDYVNHSAKLYCNGVLVDSRVNNSLPMTRYIPSQLSWDIILNPGYQCLPLGGYIDEVRIWSRVRTSAEIASNYNQCMVGNEQDLLLYYRCNQSSGSQAQDATSNGLNGMLTNSSAWSAQQPTLAGSNCTIGCSSSCPPITCISDTTICPGGSAQLNATSGFTSYTWTPSNSLSNPNISNPISSPSVTTQYVVTATTLDSNLQVCTSKDSVIVIVKPRTVPVLNLGNDITLCTSGVHTFNAGGGFLSYSWNDGSSGSSYTAFGPGKYWVTVRDSCGGIQSDTVRIILGPTPILNMLSDTTICISDSIILTFSGGSYISYQWSPANGLSCVHCPYPYANPISTTQYYLFASTIDGCIAKDSILVRVNQNIPTSLIISNQDEVCSLNNGEIHINGVQGGIPPFLFSINNNSFTSLTDYFNLGANTYGITVKDSVGCVFKTSVTIVDNPGPSGVSAIIGNSTNCESIGSIILGNVNGGTPPYLYSFNQSIFTGITSYTSLNIGTYTVSVKDSNDCIYTGSFVILEIPEEENIVIPNCFTPNGDGLNDTWFIRGNCIETIICTIYNRWGQEMITLTDIKANWTGNLQGKALDDGTYFYVVSIIFDSGKSFKGRGSIQLTR